MGPSLVHAVKSSADCATLQKLLYSAHSSFPSDDPEGPHSPTILPLSALADGQRQSATWLPGVAVVIPAYPHHYNIFHYGFSIAQTMHFATVLPHLLAAWRGGPDGGQKPKPRAHLQVTLLFRGQLPTAFGVWQQQLGSQVLLPRFRQAGLDVLQILSFNDTAKMDVSRSYASVNATAQGVTCARMAVLMGKRSDVFLWPFSRAQTDIATNGTRVPIEALSFRSFAYGVASVPTGLSRAVLARGAMQAVGRLVVDLQPRVVGYERRNREGDATEGVPAQKGSKRRFSGADERWFVSMLREKALAAGMRFVTVQMGENMQLRWQISAYADVGVIAGIPGANLVNTAFMKLFGALVEVANVPFRCYRGSMNSGLWFATYKPMRVASKEESACEDEPCASDLNHRRVLVDGGEDRRPLRRLVREGIRHVDGLHRRFGSLGGIPVVYDEFLA